jgi:hypothetical protein
MSVEIPNVVNALGKFAADQTNVTFIKGAGFNDTGHVRVGVGDYQLALEANVDEPVIVVTSLGGATTYAAQIDAVNKSQLNVQAFDGATGAPSDDVAWQVALFSFPQVN